jgi:hypothetical protein
MDQRTQRETDLVAYYDNEVRDRADRSLPAQRIAQRVAYLELVEREGIHSILEIGSGPGRDGEALVAAGFGLHRRRPDSCECGGLSIARP